MAELVDISSIDRAELLVALVNKAISIRARRIQPLSIENARNFVKFVEENTNRKLSGLNLSGKCFVTLGLDFNHMAQDPEKYDAIVGPQAMQGVVNSILVQQLLSHLALRSEDCAQILVGIAKASTALNPDSWPTDGMDVACLRELDNLGLRGSDIVRLYGICGDDYEKTALVVLGLQSNIVSDDDILRVAQNNGQNDLDVDGIIRRVQNSITGCRKIVPDSPGSHREGAGPEPKVQ